MKKRSRPRDPRTPGRAIVETANQEAEALGLCPPNAQILERIGDKNNEREITPPTETTKESSTMSDPIQTQNQTQNQTPAAPPAVQQNAAPQQGTAIQTAPKKESSMGERVGDYALNTLGYVVSTAAVGFTVLGVLKAGQAMGVIMTPEQVVEASKNGANVHL